MLLFSKLNNMSHSYRYVGRNMPGARSTVTTPESRVPVTPAKHQAVIAVRAERINLYSKLVETGIFSFFTTQKSENFLFHTVAHIAAFPVMVGAMDLQVVASWIHVWQEAEKKSENRNLLKAIGNALWMTSIGVAATAGLILTFIGLAAIGSFLFVGALSVATIKAGHHAIEETRKDHRLRKEEKYTTAERECKKAYKAYKNAQNNNFADDEVNRLRAVAKQKYKIFYPLEKAARLQARKAGRAWVNTGFMFLVTVAIVVLMVVAPGAANAIFGGISAGACLGGAGLAAQQLKDMKEAKELQQTVQSSQADSIAQPVDTVTVEAGVTPPSNPDGDDESEAKRSSSSPLPAVAQPSLPPLQSEVTKSPHLPDGTTPLPKIAPLTTAFAKMTAADATQRTASLSDAEKLIRVGIYKKSTDRTAALLAGAVLIQTPSAAAAA